MNHHVYSTKRETVAAAIQGDSSRHMERFEPWEALPTRMQSAFLSLADHAIDAAGKWDRALLVPNDHDVDHIFDNDGNIVATILQPEPKAEPT